MQLTNRQPGIGDEQARSIGSSVIVAMHRMQAEAERYGTFDKRGQID